MMANADRALMFSMSVPAIIAPMAQAASEHEFNTPKTRLVIRLGTDTLQQRESPDVVERAAHTDQRGHEHHRRELVEAVEQDDR